MLFLCLASCLVFLHCVTSIKMKNKQTKKTEWGIILVFSEEHRFRDASAMWCSTSGGITSIVYNVCNQSQRVCSSWKAMEPHLEESRGKAGAKWKHYQQAHLKFPAVIFVNASEDSLRLISSCEVPSKMTHRQHVYID